MSRTAATELEAALQSHKGEIADYTTPVSDSDIHTSSSVITLHNGRKVVVRLRFASEGGGYTIEGIARIYESLTPALAEVDPDNAARWADELDARLLALVNSEVNNTDGDGLKDPSTKC